MMLSVVAVFFDQRPVDLEKSAPQPGNSADIV